MIKTLNLILLNLLLATNILFAQLIKRDTVYFKNNNYEVNAKAKKQLDKSCEIIKENQFAFITLIGHADSEGSKEHNLTLSKKRAQAILYYFISKGISKDKFAIKYLGEVSPVSLNNSDYGKQKNRRVEIIIENKTLLIGDIFKKLEKELQYFKVNGSSNIEIKGNEGTIIKIPKNAFVTNTSDKVSGEVEIYLKEFYSKADILASNLHTMSDKHILETGGMIYISVTSSGEKLKLKKGMDIEIEFSSRNNNQDMGIFLGYENNNNINWVQQIESNHYSVSSEQIKVGITQNDGFNKYGDDSNAVAELKKIDRIILNSSELGWINCDRFNESNNTTDLIVNIDKTFKPIVRLVFKDINAIMPGYYNMEQKITFNAIPVGQEATLVAFSLVNNEPYFISKNILISKNQKENLRLIKTTMSTLKSNFEKLN